MSTSSQPNFPPPSWKQEVNQRLAEHKNRKGTAAAPTAFVPNPGAGSSRAGQAAARVAARYAKAPSYSDLQAAETDRRTETPRSVDRLPASLLPSVVAQPVTRPADSLPPRVPHWPRIIQEPATETAPQLENIDLPFPSAEFVEPAPVMSAKSAVDNSAETGPFDIRWDPDMPFIPADAANAREEASLFASGWTQREVSATLRNEPIEIAGSQPLQANLIQFPRELVATRKLRPRLAELPPGAVLESEDRLSIFEVDPQAIAPETATVAAFENPIPVAAQAKFSPQWSGAAVARPGPEWSGLEFDAHPWEATRPATDPATPTEPLRVAPLGWRTMAGLVDAGLIGGAFVLVTFIAAGSMHRLPTGKPLEFAATLGLIATWFAYHAVFFALAKSTPGMRYAGLTLSTMSGTAPSWAQLRSRLWAMALSILPLGFGVVWTLFDEQHLSWHDRISHTYLRLG